MHGDELIVHVYEGNDSTANVWLPLWTDPDGDIRRRKDSKEGEAYIVTISMTDVNVVGELKPTYRLSEDLKDLLNRKNLI